MATKAKAAPLLSSNKDRLKKNAALLPVKPVKDPVQPALVEPVNKPVKPVEEAREITDLVEQIKATGTLKNIYCNCLNFGLARSKRSALTSEEIATLEDPLNLIEVKILEWLPEYIRKHADKGGPGIDLLVATGMIIWAKNQEVKTKEPDKKPVRDPVQPAPDKPKPVNPLDPIPDEKEIKVNVT